VKEGEEEGTIACKNTQIVGKEVQNVQKSQLSVTKIRRYYSAWRYTYRIFQIWNEYRRMHTGCRFTYCHTALVERADC